MMFECGCVIVSAGISFIFDMQKDIFNFPLSPDADIKNYVRILLSDNWIVTIKRGNMTTNWRHDDIIAMQMTLHLVKASPRCRMRDLRQHLKASLTTSWRRRGRKDNFNVCDGIQEEALTSAAVPKHDHRWVEYNRACPLLRFLGAPDAPTHV